MRGLIIFLCLLGLYSKSFGAQQASQVLYSELPQILEIEKIIVENIEYNRDEPMPNMIIKETTPVNANNLSLRLSPVKVKLHTNASSPVIVSALFKELNHKDGLYNFSQATLSVIPTSQTISNPYDHVITDIFTPYVNVKPDSVLGLYRGTLVFTVGGIWRNYFV